MIAALPWTTASPVRRPATPASAPGRVRAAPMPTPAFSTIPAPAPMPRATPPPTLKMSPSGSRFERNLVAEPLEPFDGAASRGLLAPLVEVGGSQIGVDGPVLLEEVIGDHQDGVGHRHHRPFRPSARLESMELGGQIGVLGPSRRPARFHQRLPQVRIALAGGGTAPLAGALVAAGTQLGPTGQMAITREATHVHPDGRDDLLGAPLAHARNGIQPVQLILKRAQALLDLGTHPLNGLIQLGDVLQLEAEQRPLVLPHAAFQRRRELLRGRFQPGGRQLGHGFGIRRAGHQGLQHGAPGDPHGVADHRSQLDIRPLQHLLDAVDLPGALSDQAAPIADQLLEFPLAPIGDEAPFEQPMLQQIGDPLRVTHVGLATRDRLAVFGVDYQELHPAVFQQVIDRFPEDPGRLHGDMGTPLLLEPVAHGQQVPGHGPEGPHLLALWCQRTGHHRLLVDIQPTTPLVEYAHRSLLLPGWNGWSGRPAKGDSTLRAPRRAGATCRGALGRRGQATARVHNTKVVRPSSIRRVSSAPALVSSFVAPLRGMGGYTYDAADELCAIDYTSTPSACGSGSHDVTYSYNDLGERTQMVDSTGTSSYQYDSLDRLTQDTDGAGNT